MCEQESERARVCVREKVCEKEKQRARVCEREKVREQKLNERESERVGASSNLWQPRHLRETEKERRKRKLGAR